MRMNIITDKLNTLKAVLELIDELDNQKGLHWQERCGSKIALDSKKHRRQNLRTLLSGGVTELRCTITACKVLV